LLLLFFLGFAGRLIRFVVWGPMAGLGRCHHRRHWRHAPCWGPPPHGAASAGWWGPCWMGDEGPAPDDAPREGDL
jgi:hypothetical protein